jgi:hypothetical protein
MRTILAIIGAVAVLALGACGEDSVSAKVTLPGKISEADRTMAAKAIDTLATVCPRLREAWPDFTRAEAEIEPAMMSESRGAAETRGWGRTVFLTVTVDNQARHFPRETRASGHALQFIVGGGRKPGVYVMKDQAGWVCDMAPGQAYMDVADLSFVR